MRPDLGFFLRRRGWAACVAWLGCSIALVAVWWQPKTAALDADEIYWIGSAYYYHLAFEQRDWHNPDWQLLPAREHPQVARDVIGLSLALSGQQIVSLDTLGTFFAVYQGIPGAWGKGLDYEKRERVVARMDPDVYRQVRGGATVTLPLDTLLPARRTMLACVLVASLLVLLFGRAMGSWLAGLVASQLTLVHPAVVFACNHAAADPVALMFCSGAALVGFCFVRAFAPPQPVRVGRITALALATGTLLGLACGAKMDSLIVVFAIGTAIGVSAASLWLRRERRRAAIVLGLGAAMMFAAFVVFVVLNPVIVTDPLGGLPACITEHQAVVRVQAAFISGHLTSLAGKFGAVARLAFFGWLGGVAFAALATWWACKGVSLALRFAAGWWLTGLVCLTAWIPFSAQRYIMPLVVPSALLIGWALQAGLGTLRRLSCPAQKPEGDVSQPIGPG